MDKAEERHEPQEEPRCDLKQLELLLKCSEERDMTEWNNWRKENPKEEIWLEEAHLNELHLEGVDLTDAHLEGAFFELAHLKEAYLLDAHLQRTDLLNAHLQGAHLRDAHLEGAELFNAHLEGANLIDAHFSGARLDSAHLKGAKLDRAHLEGADLRFADLKGANLRYAHLEGANLEYADLEGANFTEAIVNGSTLFWHCPVSYKTDFRGVSLGGCRIDERTKYLLEYNRRRMNWEDWYRGQSLKRWLRTMRQLLTCPVRSFWCLSDYGRSTIRILAFFLALAIVFAVAYWGKPDCVMVNGEVGGLQDFLHALYFSVVTMTTLGFGDIAANPQSSCGQVLLMVQVFCGYFLLGAVVTRLSILFTAGGPAGKFSKREK